MFGVSVGLGVALLLLLPRSTFGGSLLMASLPLVAGVGIMAGAAVIRRERLHLPTGFWIFGAVVVSGIVGALFTGQLRDLTVVGMVGIWAIWFFAGNLLPRERDAAVVVIVCAGVLIAALCIIEALTGSPLFAADPNPHPNPIWPGIRAQATLPHPLVCSFVLAVVAALVLRMRLAILPKALAVTIVVAGIASTGSSSGLAVAVLAAVFAAVTSGSFGIRALRGALIAGAAGAVLIFTPALDAIADDLSLTTNSHRLNSLLAVPELFTRRQLGEVLLGSGWDSTQWLYQRGVLINDGFFAVDNLLVTMLAVGGILGLAAFVGFTVIVFLRGHGPTLLAFSVAIIMGLSFDVLLWPIAGALLAFTGAAATAAYRRPRSGPRSHTRELTIQGIGSSATEYRLYGVKTPV